MGLGTESGGLAPNSVGIALGMVVGITAGIEVPPGADVDVGAVVFPPTERKK